MRPLPDDKLARTRAQFRVRIVEVLYVLWRRRKRSRSGEVSEDRRHLGYSLNSVEEFLGPGHRVFPGFEELGDGWGCWEGVVASYEEARLPRAAHPDFAMIRVPGEGEIFDSPTAPLLWLSPTRIIPLEGSFAILVLGERHGDVVGDLKEVLENAAFDKALDKLQGEFQWELEGHIGKRLIELLTAQVARTDLIRADEDVIDQIALEVTKVLIEEVGPGENDGSPY